MTAFIFCIDFDNIIKTSCFRNELCNQTIISIHHNSY
jgi:hypothetical protein